MIVGLGGMRISTNQIGNRINELSGKNRPADPTVASLNGNASPQPAAKTGPSTEERRGQYVEALAAVRKIVDATKQQYTTLAADADLKTAVETINKKSARIKHAVGPSKRFTDLDAALEKAEAKAAADDFDVPTATTSSKKKTSKVAKKK